MAVGYRVAEGRISAPGWQGRGATAQKWRGMNTGVVFSALLTVVLLALPVGQASAQSSSAPRVALVIGNAKYPDAESPLKDAISDARALADELKRDEFGFEVELAENLTKDGMLRA